MRLGSIKYILALCVLLFARQVCAQEPVVPPAQAAPGSLEAALALEDPSERIAALKKFIKTNIIPEQSRTALEAIVAGWAQLGETRLGENEIEKAVADFRSAISAIPETVTDRFFETTIVRIPQVVSLRGYRNEAIELARTLEKRYKGEAARLAAIGDFYIGIEAPIDAIRALEAAVTSNEDDARMRRSLGAAYRMGLRLDESITEYQQAIRIDPGDKRAYYELANLYRAHGAYEDAIKLYRKQLEIDPKFLAPYKGLALALLALGNEDQAMTALNQARDLRGSVDEIKQDIYLQTQMAFSYLRLKNFKQARQAADTAIAVEPRYAWARIAAAEVDLAEDKFFDAERNLLAAQKYAGFATLLFTLGKLYVAVEDFDGAVEQFSKVFAYSGKGTFTARLGDVLEIKADNLKELLAREHQAAIFLADSPTSDEQLRIIESLTVFNAILKSLKSDTGPRIARSDGGRVVSISPQQLAELDRSAAAFIDAENLRKAFRALYIAQHLTRAGVAVETAAELADQVLGLAAAATEFDGSLRDYPNYDREGRLRILRGRALDIKGWALYKSGRNEDAAKALIDAVESYGPLPEGKQAIRHLAAVKESSGELSIALDLYVAGFEAPSQTTSLDLNRTVIEMIYRKLNFGSLDGLDDKLKRAALDDSGRQLNDSLARLRPASKVEPVAEKSANSESSPPTQISETKPAENKPPGFRYFTPFPAQTKDRNSGSINVIRPQAKREAPQPGISKDDPIFARNSAPAGPVVENKPAAAPAVKKPVLLPLLAPEPDFAIPLSPPINQRIFYSQWDDFLSKSDEDIPPAPAPKASTRKRRVTTPEDPPRVP